MSDNCQENSRVNPITVEVVRNSLMRAAEEMRVTVQRAAYSSLISECVDFCCAILDVKGRSIAETSGIPNFIGNLPEALKECIRVIGLDHIEEGDVLFCNDPYSGGFSHNPDVTVLCPVFYNGHIDFFTGFKGHVLDMGGIYAGGWYNGTTDTYQEGIMFPPVKLYTKGQPCDDIFRVISRNSRVSDTLLGDIRAMVSAVRVGGQRIRTLLDKYGEETFLLSIEENIKASAKIARKAVEAIPDGVYQGYYYCDSDGDDWHILDTKIKTNITITVKGDQMTVDLSGSSPQSKGPMNVPEKAVLGVVRHGFKTLTTPFLPNNEGCFEPLELIQEKGTIYCPQMPAATSMLWIPSVGIPDLMYRLLTADHPDKARGGNYGDLCSDYIYGTDPRSGELYIMGEPTAGGWGGKPYADGETMFSYLNGDSNNIPAEIIEVRYPVRLEAYELRQDTAGIGKFRGGLGLRKEYRTVDHDAYLIGTFDRQKETPPWGVCGGKDAQTNMVEVVRQNGEVEHYNKLTELPFAQGDIVYFMSGGGGGYGDVAERDPQAVKWDVINEYISKEAAEKLYGVRIDHDELEEMKRNYGK